MAKKRRTRKRKIRYEKKYTKLVKELNELKIEEENLTGRLISQKKQDKKNFHIKNLQIFGTTLNLFSPYLVTFSLVSAIAATSGAGFPFYLDNITKTKFRHLEYDNDNNITIEETYNSKEWYEDRDPISELVITQPWQKDNDDYYRIKKTYIIPEEIPEEIFTCLIDGNINKIDDYLLYSTETERKNFLTEADNTENEEITIINLYSREKDDKLQYRETTKKNDIVTTTELIIALVAGIGINIYREYEYLDEIHLIKRRYNTTLKKSKQLEEDLLETKQKIKKLKNRIGGIK